VLTVGHPILIFPVNGEEISVRAANAGSLCSIDTLRG